MRKVAAVFSEAQQILLNKSKGVAIMGKEFPKLSPEFNAKAYETVSQIWTKDGHMTLDGAKKVYNYLQPKGPKQIDYEKTFTNKFLPK